MYQRAVKLSALANDVSQFMSLAEQQLEAYAVAMNALSILDRKNAWIVLPLSSENGQLRKRRKLTRNIPEDEFGSSKRNSEIVALADIIFEYTVLSARLDLVRKDSSLIQAGGMVSFHTSVFLTTHQGRRCSPVTIDHRSKTCTDKPI